MDTVNSESLDRLMLQEMICLNKGAARHCHPHGKRMLLTFRNMEGLRSAEMVHRGRIG